MTATGPEPSDKAYRTPRLAHSHPTGQTGTFDESERRVSWDELAVARLLVGDGHTVRAVQERRRGGPTADFEVCGLMTEVKTLDPGASARTLANALRRGREQGDALIIDATRSGLSRARAERGAARFAAGADLGRAGHVCVLGAGYVLTYTRRDLVRMAEPPRRGAGIGL
jgi:hypothetical protein